MMMKSPSRKHTLVLPTGGFKLRAVGIDPLPEN